MTIASMMNWVMMFSLFSTHGATDADLPRAFSHRDKHDIHDADTGR